MSDPCSQPETPPLPLTLADGQPLPESPVEAWRKHSAKNWRKKPDRTTVLRQLVCEHGITQTVKLQRFLAQMGICSSRQTISKVVNECVSSEERREVLAVNRELKSFLS
jgi:hypothetical protein